jgi:glucose/arabinose dehydrogenase
MKHLSRHFMLTTAALAVSLTVAWAPSSFAQSAPAAAAKPAADNPATLPDQEIGRRITVKAEDLPPPKTGPIAASRSMVLPYAGQVPHVPEGFTATAFVTGLEHPRRLLVLPNGDVLVAEQKVGYVTVLRDDDGDGKAD